MDVFRIAVVGVVAVILAVKIRGVNAEYGVYISLGAGLFILFFGLSELKVLTEFIQKIFDSIAIDSVYLKVLFKLIGIAYICEFSSGLCKDAGYGNIAGQIEMVGKMSILVVSMPVVLALLETIRTFLG